MSEKQTMMIETLDDFVRMLTQWHSSKVAQLNHMKTVPEGSGVALDDGPEKILTGDLREGFILGLTLALSQLGTLPFEAEVEYVDQAQEVLALEDTASDASQFH